MPPTLKMVLETSYHLPAPTTSPRAVQPYGVRGHRDGENSPQKRPRASEEKEKVIANSTPSTDEGGYFISQTKVEIDNEPLQLADRHFGLVIFRQQKGTTAKSTDWGGDYLIQADFAENTNAVTAARVAAREEAAISTHRQGTASTDENKQYDPGETGDDPLISAEVAMMYTVCLLCVFLYCFAFFAVSHVIMPGSSEDGSNQDMETRGAAFELSHGSSRSMIKRVLLYRGFLCTWTIGE